MEIGNSYMGINLYKDYFSLQLFPFGIEIFILNGIDISIVIAGISISLVLRKNISLFN